MSNKFEQLEFELEKTIAIQKHAGKFRNIHFQYLEITVTNKQI